MLISHWFMTVWPLTALYFLVLNYFVNDISEFTQSKKYWLVFIIGTCSIYFFKENKLNVKHRITNLKFVSQNKIIFHLKLSYSLGI